MEFRFDEILSYEAFVVVLQNLLGAIVKEKHLPEGGLILQDNKGETVTTHSICICEMPSPRAQGDVPVVKSILNVRKPRKAGADHVILKLPPWLFEHAARPEGVTGELKSPKDASPFYNVSVPLEKTLASQYVKALILERLAVYSTRESPFGCCGLFERCSDAGRCLHDNQFYSTACSYRHNLEQGRIFYGKNRNVK